MSAGRPGGGRRSHTGRTSACTLAAIVLGCLVAADTVRPAGRARRAPPAASASRGVFQGPPLTTPSALRLGTSRAGRLSVTSVPLEDYVARVLAGEAAPASGPRALDALAIAVRTYALANLGRHRDEGFDVCDTTHCQVPRQATPDTRRAATETAGLVLLDRGRPASIFYNAWCGGQTEVPSNVWPGAEDPSFLPSHEDPYCEHLPGWTTRIEGEALRQALNRAGYRGARLRAVSVAVRDESGRVARLRLDGLTPDEITGQALRLAVGEAIGWQLVRSTVFDLAREGQSYRLTGRGYGHGVGLCVLGSVKMAADGRTAIEILDHYFPGLPVGTLEGAAPEPTLAVPVPTSSLVPSVPLRLMLAPDAQGERPALEALVRATVSEVAGLTQVAVPDHLLVRVHPTVESFANATSLPWWMPAAAQGGEVHLLPVSVLRDRGILEPAIRTQVARLLLDPVLAGRPLWVREGAARYFTQGPAEGAQGMERPVPVPIPGLRPSRLARAEPCPTDRELAAPVSAGAAREASARALACFSAQMASGKRWVDIR